MPALLAGREQAGANRAALLALFIQPRGAGGADIRLFLGRGRRCRDEVLWLIEGVPIARLNDKYVESAMKWAEQKCGVRPHLIPPPRRDYLRQPGDMQSVRERFPWIPEWLPMVRCIGTFKDVVPARDPTRHLSVLVVVWFQDEYAPPIQEPALSQILNLDWESLATDVED